jgi:hypothetical protein
MGSGTEFPGTLDENEIHFQLRISYAWAGRVSMPENLAANERESKTNY